MTSPGIDMRSYIIYGRTSASTGHEIFYFSGFVFGRSIPADNRLAFLSPVVEVLILYTT